MKKKITMDDIKNLWLEAPEKKYVIEFYCYKNGLEQSDLSEDDKDKIYSEFYPIDSYVRDYCDNIFHYEGCEVDEELQEMYDQILLEEMI